MCVLDLRRCVRYHVFNALSVSRRAHPCNVSDSEYKVRRVSMETTVVKTGMASSIVGIIIADAGLLGVCADPGSPVGYVELYR